MENTGSGNKPNVTLACLNGSPAPPSVADGWRRLASFPDAARADFWEILGVAIVQPENADIQGALEKLASVHEIEVPDAVRAIEACDFLMARAASMNLEPETLAQDLTALSEGAQMPTAGEFLQRYGEAKPLLRNRLVEATLADHGKLLTGLDWRVDNVTGSDRGIISNATVVYLTLRYRDGNDEGCVSLQLTPEALKYLKAFTDRFGS